MRPESVAETAYMNPAFNKKNSRKQDQGRANCYVSRIILSLDSRLFSSQVSWMHCHKRPGFLPEIFVALIAWCTYEWRFGRKVSEPAPVAEGSRRHGGAGFGAAVS